MKLLLCFALCSLVFLVINGKKIKIQIESEDLVNLFKDMMYSDVLQSFASQLARRSSNIRSLNNPYHPEDELLNSFNIDDNKEIEYVSSSPKLVVSTDSLEKQNDQYLDGNDVASDDILTDGEDMKSIKELMKKHKLNKKTSNSTKNSTHEIKNKTNNAVNNNSMSSKKDDMGIFSDDRAYYKPVQRRFVLKGPNDKPTLEYFK